MSTIAKMSKSELQAEMQRYDWYHTIDLGQGVFTSGHYDHRPLLQHYRLPQSLRGKEVLDVGPAHGYFAFEMESRGASRVVTVELPRWSDHDASPALKRDFATTSKNDKNSGYLHGALEFAIQARNSNIEQMFASIYDITPEEHGIFDLVFCGSLLIHLTDPLKALYALREVCRDQCIIATTILDDSSPTPLAYFHAENKTQQFWVPNMACLERWALAAGFNRVERVSKFMLEGKPGKCLHGVIHAHV